MNTSQQSMNWVIMRQKTTNIPVQDNYCTFLHSIFSLKYTYGTFVHERLFLHEFADVLNCILFITIKRVTKLNFQRVTNSLLFYIVSNCLNEKLRNWKRREKKVIISKNTYNRNFYVKQIETRLSSPWLYTCRHQYGLMKFCHPLITFPNSY